MAVAWRSSWSALLLFALACCECKRKPRHCQLAEVRPCALLWIVCDCVHLRWCLHTLRSISALGVDFVSLLLHCLRSSAQHSRASLLPLPLPHHSTSFQRADSTLRCHSDHRAVLCGDCRASIGDRTPLSTEDGQGTTQESRWAPGCHTYRKLVWFVGMH